MIKPKPKESGPRLNRVKCSTCGKIVGSDPEIKQILKCYSCVSKKKSNLGTPATEDAAFARIKKGPAADLPEQYHQYTFRSGWERNFARYLVKANEVWEYESEKCYFKFDGYHTKPFGYLCDFYLPGKDQYYEVKGYFKGSDRNKLRRLLKQHPEIPPKLTVVISKNNKSAIQFYTKMDVKIEFIEVLRAKWGDENWE